MFDKKVLGILGANLRRNAMKVLKNNLVRGRAFSFSENHFELMH